MLDHYAIISLEKKIEQINTEIRILKDGIEEENIYIGKVVQGSDKLSTVKSNLMDVSERIFGQIGFLKSAEYMKKDICSIISGSAYEAAENRIHNTKKSLEKEKEKHYSDIERLKRMKKKYEQELADLKQRMLEAD